MGTNITQREHVTSSDLDHGYRYASVMLGGVGIHGPINGLIAHHAVSTVPHDKPGGQSEVVKCSVGAARTVIGGSVTGTRCRCSMEHPARHQGVLRSCKGV
jgi:hypothetical protein